MTQDSTDFGRVDTDGSVQVREGDTWRTVGSYPDATAEEALAYFVRKCVDLEARVALAEQRVKAGANSKDIEKQLAGLSKELIEPAIVGDIAQLRSRVEAAQALVPALKEAQTKESEEATQKALAEREALVTEMEALAATDPAKIRWKTTTTAMTELFDKWKNHQQTGPRLPKKAADELWSRFRSARTSLEKARRAYYQSLDERSKEAKAVKRELISKAQELADKKAEGIPAYRALLEKWKAAPRASRSVEDTLWAQFKAAGDVLYASKAEQEQRDDEANAGNLEAKQAIINDFADILAITERDAATARLRAFHDRFASVGPVPKKSARSIDDQVKKYEQHVKKINDEHWVKNDPEKKARSASMADQLTASIAALESELAKASGAEKTRLEEEITTKKTWLAAVSA